MATGARSYVPIKGTLARGAVIIGGYFEINGTSAPAVLSSTTDGWTVAYTSAGVWTITLDQKYRALVGSGLSFHNASTSTDFTIEWGGTLTTNNTIVVQLKTGGTLTTPATATGTGVSFMLFLATSKVA